MATPKDILVVTTTSVEGLKVKRYLKPVSAHVVAGTNLFSDFLGGLTDVFGGRSETYQKQLSSLYSEAIERVKYAAHEIGANCIVGLSIDLDEISGKGKSMFMITAIGTAVIIENELGEKVLQKTDEKFENVGVDRINVLRQKMTIIKKANSDSLKVNENIWNFITEHQVQEVFPFLLKTLQRIIPDAQYEPEPLDAFHRSLTNYIDALPEETKIELLYKGLTEQNEQIAFKLSEIIKELKLFDFNRTMDLLKSEDFQLQKRGIRVLMYDKPFYDKQDVLDLQTIEKFFEESFTERGTRTTKKTLLSSKEKEVWTCECGKTNEADVTYCIGCRKDIYGFKETEIKPNLVSSFIKEKIDLITEYLK